MTPTPPEVLEYRVVQRGAWLEVGQPKSFRHVKITLPLPGHAIEPIRFVHLSDLHLLRPWSIGLDEIIRRLRIIQPQLILFTGDWIHGRLSAGDTHANLQRMAKSMVKIAPVYSVRGNHDSALPLREMQEIGVDLIEGQCKPVTIGQRTIELVGVVGRRRKRVGPRFLSRFPFRKDIHQTARIVLTHFPDTIEKLGTLGGDLFLAGHTHAGQVCLPGGFALIRHDTLPRKFCYGLNRHRHGWLHVTSGLGCSGLWLRTFCPAEIAEFEV
jgi:uncharacterized protein